MQDLYGPAAACVKALVEVEDEAARLTTVQVRTVRVTGPGVRTARGLKIGDSASRVRRLYGEPVSIRGTVWLYTGPGDSSENYAMEIEVKPEGVTAITISRRSLER
ncbi:MAG: hypothetical protein P8174_11975 [Gemmatimonadota bacterium]